MIDMTEMKGNDPLEGATVTVRNTGTHETETYVLEGGKLEQLKASLSKQTTDDEEF